MTFDLIYLILSAKTMHVLEASGVSAELFFLFCKFFLGGEGKPMRIIIQKSKRGPL